MENNLDKYRDVVGDKIIDNIYEDASAASNKHVVHVSSTYYGGGVAEILSSLIPLMNNAGIETGWRLIQGNPDFFSVTKAFNNALQGAKIHLTNMKKRVFLECNKRNSIFTHIESHDFVFVHDPHPLPLINFYKNTKHWIWRAHFDMSNPNPIIWNYLKEFVLKYKRMIISIKEYRKKDIPLGQHVIPPCIDPLSYKNKELLEVRINKTLSKFGIELDRPIITQISRFDKWKDPIGVVKAFKLIKKKVDCRLVLLGNMATDDPEGQKVLEKLHSYGDKIEDLKIINFENDILVNALQRVSSVVIQKSLREGFGLTISEALWKGVPVVGGNVGGIPKQITDGKCGYLVNSVKECADRTVKLLKDPKLAKKMGERGREHVRKNFLITRQLGGYIKVLNSMKK